MFVVLEDGDDKEVLVILVVEVLIEPLEEMVILAFGVNGDDGVEFILVLLPILLLPFLAALVDTMVYQAQRVVSRIIDFDPDFFCNYFTLSTWEGVETIAYAVVRIISRVALSHHSSRTILQR